MALTAVTSPSVFDYAKLILLGAIWGSAFHLINLTLVYFQPADLVFLQVCLGGLTVFVVLLVSRRAYYLPKGHSWWLIILSSFLSTTLPFLFINWGQQKGVTGSEASLLIGVGPFLSLIISHFITKDERLNRWRVLAVIAGFIGLLFVFWPELVHPNAPHTSLVGKLAVVLAACCYAVGAVVGRHIAQLPFLMTSFYLLLISSLVMTPFTRLGEVQWSALPFYIIMAILFLGVVAAGFSINIRLSILRKNGIVFMTQVVYLIPIFGVLFGILIFGEPVRWQILTALCAVIIGLTLMKKAHVT